MAIYNNREVTVMTPVHRPNPPQMIQIRYQDGTFETVSIGKLQFSKDEKNALVKAFPSDYDNVTVASEDDLKAVRVGVAPASDPSYRQQAEGEVRTDEARKIDEANKQKVKEEVKKDQESQPASKTVMAPTDAKPRVK